MTEFIEVSRPVPECSEETVDTTGADDQTPPGRSNERCKLFVDGSSNPGGSEVELQYKTSQALCFNFKASNNEVEYEAVIAGLGLARELGVEDIKVFSDSMLIINQVTVEF